MKQRGGIKLLPKWERAIHCGQGFDHSQQALMMTQRLPFEFQGYVGLDGPCMTYAWVLQKPLDYVTQASSQPPSTEERVENLIFVAMLER